MLKWLYDWAGLELHIGNPLLDYTNDLNFEDGYYWSHGLISDFVYELLTKVCNNSKLFKEYTEGSMSPTCAFVNTQVSNALIDYIDQYNMIGDVCLSSVYHKSTCCITPLSLDFKLCHLSIQNQMLSVSR